MPSHFKNVLCVFINKLQILFELRRLTLSSLFGTNPFKLIITRLAVTLLINQGLIPLLLFTAMSLFGCFIEQEITLRERQAAL